MNRREFLQVGVGALIVAALRMRLDAETRPRTSGALTIPVTRAGTLPGCLPMCLATARPQRVYVPVVKGD